MDSDPNLDRDHFKKFLEEFTSSHAGTDNLPFSSVSCRLTKEEIEGECLEWVTNCLVGQNKAPPVLACAIARATVDNIISQDLSTFIVEDEVRYGDEDDIACTLYDAGQIFSLLWTLINDLCERWKTDLPELKLPTRLYPVSQYAVKNTRKRMEDKHVIIPDLNTLFNLGNDKPRAFYAVYDGHGGTDAAMYACQHLHGNAIRQDCFLDDPSMALAKSFRITDEGFLKKARREGLGSGTTGVAAIIEPDNIYISWLGDSQAFLMRDGQPVTLMEPHKPERPDEKQRIEQLGGCVLFFGVWRVNGTLAVSRAIGDPDQKPYVSSDADMTTMPLTGSEDCLIIACDGLWDVVEPKDVCRIIQEGINSESDLETISHRLVSEAKSSGSNDNITVLVVFLNPRERESGESGIMDGVADEEPTEKREDDDAAADGDKTKPPSPPHGRTEVSEARFEENGGNDELTDKSSEMNLNNNNNNNSLRQSEPGATNKLQSLSNPVRRGSEGLVVGNRISLTPSPRLGGRKRLQVRARRSSSDISPSKSTNYPIIPTSSPTHTTTTTTAATVSRHKSFPSSPSRRVGHRQVVKSHSVKSNKTTPRPAGGPLGPASDLEIASRQFREKNDSPKRTAPAGPHSTDKSMPVSVKPKSMQRAKCLPRQLELTGMLKGKPKYPTSRVTYATVQQTY